MSCYNKKMTPGEKLDAEIKAHKPGCSQAVIGNLLGIKQQSVRNYITGRATLSVRYAMLLSDYFKKPRTYFLTEQQIEDIRHAAAELTVPDCSSRVIRFDHDLKAEIVESVKKAVCVLEATHTSYAVSLRMNIDSFYESVLANEALRNLITEIKTIKENVSSLEKRIDASKPPAASIPPKSKPESNRET